MPPRPTRPITFTCEWCYREITEDQAPGRTPVYCLACRDDVRRAGLRQRVKEHRAKQTPAHVDQAGRGRDRPVLDKPPYDGGNEACDETRGHHES